MKTALRVFGVIAVIALIIVAIVASVTRKTPNSEIVWDKEMTVGNMEAENYFIVYSDFACPYCFAFENAIIDHEEDFKNYISRNDILLEVRLSDFMYQYGEAHSIQSRYGAVATYCAKNEGKFWEYFYLGMKKVWHEFFKDSGKMAFGDYNKLEKDYWIKIGKEIGLGETFETCVKSDETLPDVLAAAKKTEKLVTGMPHFKFNKFTTGGFDLGWGWDYVVRYFEAGLESK